MDYRTTITLANCLGLTAATVLW